jgi:hypothetical protein
MIKNEILLKRMCQLVSQTFAVPIENVFEKSKQIGIEAVIEELEQQTSIKY